MAVLFALGCEEGAPPYAAPEATPVAGTTGSGLCDPGRVTLRRLNRTEYDNTVRDLLGDESRPAREFPDDDVGAGFDNIGDVLSVSPLHIERYEAAAEKLVDQALRVAAPPTTLTIEAEEVGADVGAAHRDTGWNLWSNGELVVEAVLPDDAEYVIRVGAWGQQAGPEPVRMVVSFDRVEVARFDVEAVGPAPEIYEHRLRTSAGGHSIAVAFVNDYYQPDADEDRNLILDYVEIEGPYGADVPGSETRDRIMVCEPADDRDVACAGRVLAEFGRRAWRRPLSDDELRRLVALVRLAVESGDSIVVGVKLAMRALLLSPNFLYRVELDPDPNSADPHPLSDFELATRLSYFLWSTTPDDPLLDAAEAGRLQDPEGLLAQVRRMLADERAEALVENFAAQWLYVRAFDEHHPDYNYFPDFDDELRASMRQETLRFFREFLRDNLPVPSLMRTDFTWADARLADHYGLELPDPAGEGFQRVETVGVRGGLLTLGSVLTVTSFPTRTSPVRRGKWVLEQLLCSGPPPPPPGVEAELGEVDGGASLRERLAQHREKAECATCHDLMDPIGLGMENFDGVGAAREEPVDSSGELPDGRSFAGVVELSEILGADPRFASCFTDKLWVYALGRERQPYDACALGAVKARSAEQEHRMADLVELIATAPSFTQRRGEPEEEE